MKSINIFSSLLVGALLFSACESDMDDNPTLQEPTTFVLNTPAYVNGVYDLENSTTIELTCSQPDYGYTAPTTYTVEVATSQDFSTYEALSSTYTTAKMEVAADELAVAATNLKVAEGSLEEDFPMELPLYIRLKASLGTDQFGTERGVIRSNVIALEKVQLHFALAAVELPTELFLIGEFCDWSWDKSLKMVPVNSAEGVFWRMAYLTGGWKFNTVTSWGGDIGYSGCTIEDNAGAGISDDSGNIAVANAGWYVVAITATVEGRDIKYNVAINKPEVWLIGGTIKEGGDWTECLDGWMFSAPTAADGEFVSPAFAVDAADGPRVYVKIPGYDWWKSEFMVFDGKIEYRGNGGDQDRVPVTAGQRVYLKFSDGTGKIE